MIRKKYLLEKIKILERQVNKIDTLLTEIRKREEIIFHSLIKMYEHEVKYCRGITKEVYARLIDELRRSPEFNKLNPPIIAMLNYVWNNIEW